MPLEWQQGNYTISDDPARLDLATIHDYLSNHSYWAQGIPLATVQRAIAGSLNFGIYLGERQVGFARVISDRATFAYLCDVFVLEGHRRQGLSKWLMQVILAHPELQGLRRWLLFTLDAHGLYQQFGFENPTDPSRVMVIRNPDVYKTPTEQT